MKRKDKAGVSAADATQTLETLAGLCELIRLPRALNFEDVEFWPLHVPSDGRPSIYPRSSGKR